MTQDTSQAQRIASDPSTSVWVSASAGTGKTKVLIDRLFNILAQGTPLSHIICLTFTKAAAFEMHERLVLRLEHEARSHSQHSKRAATILEELLESPESLKIMTLHAFCQGLLQRFPFEARLTPFFKVLDEQQTQQMLTQALNEVLLDTTKQDCVEAIACLSLQYGEGVFKDTLIQTFQNWHKVRSLARIVPTAKAYEEMLEANLIADEEGALSYSAFNVDEAYRQSCIHTLRSFDAQKEEELAKALSAGDEAFFKAITKKDGTLYSRLLSAAFQKKHPDIAQDLIHHANCLYQAKQLELLKNWIAHNGQFWTIVQAVLEHYTTQKTTLNLLDYHDLILHGLALLSDDLDLSYIHQRLDYIIEHILVDEAQDNSLEQWQFIYQLVQLFISWDTPHRSLFVVGDLKQSIYGFQGAAPEIFELMEDKLRALLIERNHEFTSITLDKSYRTTKQILSVVDQVFNSSIKSSSASDHDTIFKMGMPQVNHSAHRTDNGWVECDTLTDDDQQSTLTDKAEPSPDDLMDDNLQQTSFLWDIMTHYTIKQSGDQKLATSVALRVQELLASTWVSPSTNQPVQPQDILILLRSRGALAPLIIKALNRLHIPTEGIDQLKLDSNLIVADLMAILKFLSLPSDDWSLCHLLKSPFINKGKGLTEELLLEIGANRTTSLWGALQQHAQGEQSPNATLFQDCVTTLKTWLKLVDYETPYHLLSHITRAQLHHMQERLGRDAKIIVDAILTLVHERQQQCPTLSAMLESLEESLPLLKRENTKPTGVRLMTIHGSKGLEAPCVLLIDRKSVQTLTQDKIIWPKNLTLPDHMTHPVFCLRPLANLKHPSLALLTQDIKDSAQEERNRLLYVALTRARDGLWVIGQGDWAKGITASLKDLPSTSFHEIRQQQADEKLIISTPLNEKPTNIAKELKLFKDAMTHVPSPLTQIKISLKKDYTSTLTSLNLAEISHEDGMSASILAKRGEMIHALFEVCERLSHVITNQVTFKTLLTDKGKKLGLTHIDIARVLDVWHHPTCQSFFAQLKNESTATSVCEMSLSHMGNLIRLDYCVETPASLIIIDFKTGKRGLTTKTTFTKYYQQLEKYAMALSGIKTKPIRKILLWVDSGIIEEVC